MLLIISHLDMMVSWLEMVRICSAMTQSSSVQCLSKQWSAMTRTNWVIDWPLETRSLADVTKASLVYRGNKLLSIWEHKLCSKQNFKRF